MENARRQHPVLNAEGRHHWTHYPNPPWKEQDKDKVTVLLSVVEPRKSRFVAAFLERLGIKHIDLGGFEPEDVNLGKRYCTPSLCNPLYFIAGQILRTLEALRVEQGLTKDEICERYVFVSPSGPCSPCRFGMYTQEYFKAINQAGYHGFRIITFSSDVFDMESAPDDALKFTFEFRINLLIALILADCVHARDMEIRPYEKEPGSTARAVRRAESLIYDTLRSRTYLLNLPRALRQVRKIFDAIPTTARNVPQIFITGEIFANNSHGAANYNLREFCLGEGCQVNPALFTMRVYFDFIRRMEHTRRALKYGELAPAERRRLARFLRRQQVGLRLSDFLIKSCFRAIGSRTHYPDVQALFTLAHPYYHWRIFGGEGNLEVAEAIEQSGQCHGFISIKPFGCMCSSGVSDGVQAKIQELYPELNFLSVETSGDNAVNALNRVSMLLFKAKRQHCLARAV